MVDSVNTHACAASIYDTTHDLKLGECIATTHEGLVVGENVPELTNLDTHPNQ